MEELSLFLKQVSHEKVSQRKIGRDNLIAALKRESLYSLLDKATDDLLDGDLSQNTEPASLSWIQVVEAVLQFLLYDAHRLSKVKTHKPDGGNFLRTIKRLVDARGNRLFFSARAIFQHIVDILSDNVACSSFMDSYSQLIEELLRVSRVLSFD